MTLESKYSLPWLVVVFLLLLGVAAQGQKILPSDSFVIDKRKVKQCQKLVDGINAMHLIQDTIKVDGSLSLYFDKKRRLRKYFRSEYTPDGDHGSLKTSAYYDVAGDLVYISLETGNNCEDNDEKYYLEKGRIVDFTVELSCYCCDDSIMSVDEINSMRPQIGAPLKGVFRPLTNFIKADVLLGIFKREDYETYGGEYLTPDGAQ